MLNVDCAVNGSIETAYFKSEWVSFIVFIIVSSIIYLRCAKLCCAKMKKVTYKSTLLLRALTVKK